MKDIEKTADYCLSCTTCMASCPVMAATADYRGPKLVGPAHGRLHFAQEDTEESLALCSNCKSCDRACPQGVAISTLNMLSRGKFYGTHTHRYRDAMLAHVEKTGKMVHSLPFGAKLANLGTSLGQALGILGLFGIAKERHMPTYASVSFQRLFKGIKQKPCEKKVVFFPGCFIENNQPWVGVKFVEVMQKNGYEVLLDDKFVCCGSPMVVMGFLAEAKTHGEQNLLRLSHWKEEGIPVVSCCTSCTLMFKQEYGDLFGGAEMEKTGENVYDAFEFLEILEDEGRLNKDFHPVEENIFYHVPCHLKSQAIGTPAARILREIPGVDLTVSDEFCCGMSGNYGFKEDKYAISMKIGEKLFAAIREKKPDTVISDCGTCRLQIEEGTAIRPIHPIEILARAYAYTRAS